MRIGFTISFFLLLAQFCHAQSEAIDVKIYGFEEGLSHRNVYDIEQDHNGFIWLGTYNGLNKFDGQQFIHYGAGNAIFPIKSNQIKSLEIKAEQLCCIGDAGAEWLDLEKGKLVNRNFFAESMPDAEWEVDERGDLEHRVDGKITSYELDIPNAEANWLSEVITNTDGIDYALSKNGYLYSKQADETYFERDIINYVLPKQNGYEAMLWENMRYLWVAGIDILGYVDIKGGGYVDINQQIEEVVGHRVTYRDLMMDDCGVIWVASDFGAIKLARSNDFFNTILSGGNEACAAGNCSMRGITEDGYGNLYFAHYNSIQKIENGRTLPEPLFPYAEFDNAPFGIHATTQHIYTGNGLRINLSNYLIDTLFNSTMEDKGVVAQSNEDALWFGYDDGLYLYEIADEKLTDFSNWNKGFDTLNPQINWLHYGQYSNTLWLGTQAAGVYQFDMNTSKVIAHYEATRRNAIPLSNNRILAIEETSEKELWIGTASGLNRVNPLEKTIQSYTTKNGLPNDFINGLVSEGDSAIWVSTDNGLGRLRLSDGHFDNYFEADGIPSNEFNRSSFFKSADGRIFFGGLNGIVVINPVEALSQKSMEQEGQVLFTQFSKFDGSEDTLMTVHNGIGASQCLNLSWRDRFFTFGFSLADYANPRSHRYSYKLEGYDKDWSNPSNVSIARYDNIPAGDYTFSVRAATGNKGWNEAELHVPVSIMQAYYKNPWFVACCALLLLGLIYGVMRYRIYNIRKNERNLEKQVALRTQELQAEKQKADTLLLNILPANIAEELKTKGKAKAQRHDQVTVFFSDFKNFTQIAQGLEPEALVAEIDYCFRAFDEIIGFHGLEKIKTIGDAYMCVGGINEDAAQGALSAVHAALDIQDFLEDLAMEKQRKGLPYFEARIGLHTGPIVAGIVGSKKFAYDIWGDTVNLASRMESAGEAGKVNVSQETLNLLGDTFETTSRGAIEIKNKGKEEMYFVKRIN